MVAFPKKKKTRKGNAQAHQKPPSKRNYILRDQIMWQSRIKIHHSDTLFLSTASSVEVHIRTVLHSKRDTNLYTSIIGLKLEKASSCDQVPFRSSYCSIFFKTAGARALKKNISSLVKTSSSKDLSISRSFLISRSSLIFTTLFLFHMLVYLWVFFVLFFFLLSSFYNVWIYQINLFMTVRIYSFVFLFLYNVFFFFWLPFVSSLSCSRQFYGHISICCYYRWSFLFLVGFFCLFFENWSSASLTQHMWNCAELACGPTN